MRLAARRRESGALLLTVVLMLAILAAAAFGLGRGAGMATASLNGDYERRRAAYLAEAGLAAIKWSNQINCNNGGISPFKLDGGDVSATATKPKGGKMDVTAGATTAAGTVATLARKEVKLVDFSSTETKDLGDGLLDTTIDRSLPQAQDAMASLNLNAGSAHALVFWSMKEIPKESRVLAATLTLVKSDAGTVARTVDLHRVTSKWDPNATWTRARPDRAWSGGDYSATPVASVRLGAAASYQWNVTGLVDSWVAGLVPNDGMLLRLPDAGQNAAFHSRDLVEDPKTLPSRRPILNVTFAKLCK